MKRTIILLIVFLTLGGGTAWLLIKGEDDRSLMAAGADRAFKVENTDEIYKIFLADRRGNQTLLERKDGYWLYNKEHRARPNAVENLLNAVGQIEMKFKPPRAAVDNMVKNLATQGIKVEIYDRQDELMNAYYVGGSTPDERATYMMIEGADEPYVVSIPTWEGNVRFRYNLTGDDWRDKTLVPFTVEQIQSVTVEYPKQKNKSFTIEKNGNNYEVSPYYRITPAINRPVKEGSAEAFLIGLEGLGAEAFENENPRRDSVSNLIPFCRIMVTDTKGEELEVNLHPIYEGRQVDPKTGMLVSEGTMERYFADCSTGDFMLVQHLVFKKVLWAYEYFYE